MYKLRIEKGPEEGKTLPIPEDGLALGRSSQNDVAIRDEMLSRRQRRLQEITKPVPPSFDK